MNADPETPETRRQTPLEAALSRFMRSLPAPREESPELLAERAAQYAMKCRGLRDRSGVEERFAGMRLTELGDWLPGKYRKLAGVFLTMLDEPQLIAVGGDRGTGKTALACGLVLAFCNNGRRARYVRAKDYFDTLSGVVWTEKPAVRKAFSDPDLLVLDEVQVRDADRDWQDNELTTLIDKRYGQMRSTLLLSNLKPEAFRANVGESVWRRVSEQGGCYEADWPRIEMLKRQHLVGRAPK